MPSPSHSVKITFIDNPHAPEVYADAASGIGFSQGNIRLTFESARVDHSHTPSAVNRVVICRLILPLEGAEGLRDMLNQYLARTKQGLEEMTARGAATIQ